MDDTILITPGDIEAVAEKIDAGTMLDDRDRVILRAVFLLAGRATVETVDAVADVHGFSGDPGPGIPADGSPFGFPAAALTERSTPGSFNAGKTSTTLFKLTAKGTHYKEVRIT